MQTRHLTIMLTDIKGFTSRTAQQSRTEMMEHLKQHKDVVLPELERFRGKVVKTIGDAFLVTFDSPTDAVLCGVAVQEALKSHNMDKSHGDKIEIRIAINSGEVTISEDNDIFGDAVNITARLESIAEAGEVFFTEAVYLAMNKKEVPSSEIGYRQFKGISEKIKVYRVLREVPVGAQPPEQLPEAEAGAGPIPAPVPPAPAALPAIPAAAPLSTRAQSLAIDLLLFLFAAAFLGEVTFNPFQVFFSYRAIFWVLYVAMFTKRGATPGMMLMKLKLIDVNTGLAPQKPFRRAICGVVSMLPLGLGYFWAFRDPEQRTWHDIWTDTKIINA